jgi:hypothetical protein
VALGGKVLGASRAVVRGSVSQVAELKIPFVGMLGSQFSIQALGFGRHILGYVLLGFGLFLSSYYFTAHARGLYQGLIVGWRPAVITIAVSVVLVPLLVVLLIASVVGIFLLPLLAILLALVAIDGFLLLCSRVGSLLRAAGGSEEGEDWLFFLSSGLLGLFLIKLPALAGILLTMVRSEPAARVGQILQMVSLGLMAAGLLYGFGTSLAQARMRAAPNPRP